MKIKLIKRSMIKIMDSPVELWTTWMAFESAVRKKIRNRPKVIKARKVK